MAALDTEYLFVLKDQDESIPSMTPDEDTSRKPYDSTLLPQFQKPLVFRNGAQGYQRAGGIQARSPPPEVLFDGADVLVSGLIRAKLLGLKLPRVAIQPAIFIDDKDGWHEDYWYLTFLSMLDCWDRTASVFDPDPLEVFGVLAFGVYQYVLDRAVLEAIPLEARLLFKMGGTTTGFVVVHESIADIFRKSGVVLVPVADYGVRWP